MSKKKKNAISKRQAKTKQNKARKNKAKNRRLKLVHSRSNHPGQWDDDPSVFDRKPLGATPAPPGFMLVTMSHAMSEFAQPLLDRADRGSLGQLNEHYQAATAIWNLVVAKNIEGDSKGLSEAQVLKALMDLWGESEEKARAFLDMMIARKEHLLPENIQPKGGMTMFLRKEVSCIISRFDAGALNLSPPPASSGAEDRAMVDKIVKMDDALENGEDASRWEDLYFDMEKTVQELFTQWLEARGAPQELAGDFGFHAGFFMNFIYRYGHGHPTLLKSVPIDELALFFADHVVRKLVMKPHEYPQIPPALTLFYEFLTEKGYMDDATDITEVISAMEPEFLQFLQHRFG